MTHRNPFKRFYQQQFYPFDCGLACIQMILNYYGMRSNYQEMVNHFLLYQGINLKTLQDIFKAKGIESMSYRNLNSFKSLPKTPFIIIQIKNNLSHAVVCFKIDYSKETLLIADPAKGWFTLSYNRLITQNPIIIIIQTPTKTSIKPKINSIYLNLFKLIYKDQRATLWQLFNISLALGLFTSIVSFALQNLIDRVSLLNKVGVASSLIFLMLIALLLKCIIEFAFYKIWAQYHQKLGHHIFPLLFNKIISLKNEIAFSLKQADYLAILNDLKTTIAGQQMILFFLFSELLLITFYLGICLFYSFKVFLAIILFLIPAWYISVNSYMKLLLLTESKRLAQIRADEEYLSLTNNLYSIKTGGVINPIMEVTNNSFFKAIDIQHDAFLTSQRIQLTLNILMALQVALCIYLLISEYVIGSLTIGTLSTLLPIIFLLLNLSYKALKLPLQLKEVEPYMERTFNILSNATIINEMPLINDFSQIDIVEWSLKHPKTNSIILANIKFTLIKNTLTVIKGQNGSGKSLLLQSLIALYPKYKGKISLDLKNYDDLSNLNFSIVLQEPPIWNNTLHFNIFLNDGKTEDEQLRFLEILGLNDFINHFPKGLLTQMGYQGYQASLGEKKLIGIVREIYKKPSLLIMDEPTASLDHTKCNFIYQIINLLKSKTTLLIATHDENITKLADEVLDLSINKNLK